MNAPQILYIVTYDYIARAIGRCHGTADLNLNEHSQSEIANMILAGLIPGVEQVFECAEGEPRKDVTQDVATLVCDRILSEGHELDYDMATWLHKVLGTDAIAWPAAAE